MADGFMSAADNPVGASPSPPPRTVSATAYRETAEGRRAYAQQRLAEGARTAARDRLRETQIPGRIMDTAELAHLNPADLQSVKDGGEALLVDLTRMRERELEGKRSRGGREWQQATERPAPEAAARRGSKADDFPAPGSSKTKRSGKLAAG
jgi:hypothetical protein